MSPNTSTRRGFAAALTTTAVTALAGCSTVSLGGDDPEPEFLDEDETPDAVAEAKPLAADFMQEVTPHYEDATVRLNEKGEIAVDYRTTLENQSGVKKEFYRIAELFVDVVRENDHDATTLSIITGEVQAVVPEIGVNKYANGEFERGAFHESIGITTVKRRDAE